ncbi:MAG: hypothetical protein QW186_05050 [Candidatus Bathyarchaeia archaeon]
MVKGFLLLKCGSDRVKNHGNYSRALDTTSLKPAERYLATKPELIPLF